MVGPAGAGTLPSTPAPTRSSRRGKTRAKGPSASRATRARPPWPARARRRRASASTRRRSWRRGVPVGPDRPRERAQVLAQLLVGRPAPEPVAVVGGVDRQVRREREDRGDVGVVDRVGRLAQAEALLLGAVGVAQ